MDLKYLSLSCQRILFLLFHVFLVLRYKVQQQVWQLTYTYDTPHIFPAGTVLHSVAWHDNTSANRHNPDPSAWIGWGGRTMDDMGNAWTDIAFMTEEQYEKLRDQRDREARAEADDGQ